MTREQELEVLQEFLEKNGATKLPPDARSMDSNTANFSVWKRRGRGRGRKKKVAKK